MSDNPLVSIVIPVYNQQESFLRECIESALAQTYSNLEIIISDNHSTDNVPRVLAEYAAKDKTIRIVSPEKFLPLAESFMFVFTQARGKYSCFVSSDDILIPTCVETLVQKAEENDGVVFAHGQAIYFNSDNSSSLQWKYFNNKNGVYGFDSEACERLINFTYVCFGGCLVNNIEWEKMALRMQIENIHVAYSLDILIVLLLFQQGKVYYHNDVLAKVRIENETRNTRLPHLVNDAVAIRNFMSRDEKIASCAKKNNIDLAIFKRKQFINFHKDLLIQYGKGYFEVPVFRTVLQNLRSFHIKTPLLYSVLDKFAVRFPKLSTKAFRLLRSLRK